MKMYSKIVCDKNRKIVEFIKAVDVQEAYRLTCRPTWRYVGKTQYGHLVSYTPTSPIQFISAIQNTKLVNIDSWHYDFSVSLVNGEDVKEISFEDLLDFYCKHCDELSTSSSKEFKEVCQSLRDNLKLNEELKSEAFNEHGKLI